MTGFARLNPSYVLIGFLTEFVLLEQPEINLISSEPAVYS